jgi:Xaa-Pro aminopeptidase
MPDNLLIVADSERDANMLYAVGMFVPDPFIYLRLGGKCHVVMSDLEVDRAREQARHCKVLSWSRCVKQIHALAAKKRKSVSIAEVIRFILRERQLKRVIVPSDFPLGLAEELRALKIKVKVRKGEFFPEREVKSAEEVKKISGALIMAEVGLAEGIQALKASKVGRGKKLIYRNNPLTADKLRAVIDTAILQAGGLPANTIVAGGAQACDPHERGHGLLRAGEPIVIDVFPRSQKTGYFGDITRTVVKGRPSEAARALYDAVHTAQGIAFHFIRRGTRTAEVHQKVQEFFSSRGFKTGQQNGRMQGFFHGTGHGLGMDVHEMPRLGPNSNSLLRPGHVVTVEPGLYYHGIGGVRLEDVAHITRNGPKNLTKFEKVFEV